MTEIPGWLSTEIRKKMSGLHFANVLDVGCGTGEMLKRIAAKFPDVRLYGLDLSENMLRTAKEKLGDDADLTIGDAEALPFEDGTFDLLLCNDSFHHYPAPDKVLMEFMRVLKPEGTLLLSDYCMAFPLRQLMNVFIRFSDDGDVRIYSEKEITRLLQDAGFRDIIYGRTYKTGCVIECRKMSDKSGGNILTGYRINEV